MGTLRAYDRVCMDWYVSRNTSPIVSSLSSPQVYVVDALTLAELGSESVVEPTRKQRRLQLPKHQMCCTLCKWLMRVLAPSTAKVANTRKANC